MRGGGNKRELVSQLKTLNGRLRFIDDEEPASLNKVWFTEFANLFPAVCVCTRSGEFYFDLGAEQEVSTAFFRFCDCAGITWVNICAFKHKEKPTSTT